MKQLRQWLRAHPWKAAAFFVLFVISGALLAAGLTGLGLCLLIYGYVAWAVVFTVDSMRLLSVLLIAGLLAAPAQADEPEPAPLIIGGVVVIGIAGIGFVGYKAYKACKRIAAKRSTNAPPEELRGENHPMFFPAGSGEYGAAFSFGLDSTCAPDVLRPPPGPFLPREHVTFTLNIDVVSTSNAVVTVRADVGEEYSQTFPEFQQEMAGHGLIVSTSPFMEASFERNRHPCSAEEVPISMDWETRIIRNGSGGVLVTVERSADLRTWEPLIRTDVEEGSKLCVEDYSNDGAGFYRVKARKR